MRLRVKSGEIPGAAIRRALSEADFAVSHFRARLRNSRLAKHAGEDFRWTAPLCSLGLRAGPAVRSAFQPPLSRVFFSSRAATYPRRPAGA
jgi:hypothetical protein